MISLPVPVIVVTDLDGTLLDHHNYRYDAAKPAIDFLKQEKIPLILNSSKTAAEIRLLREELDNHDPFVVENGAGIYLPDKNGNKRINFGMQRQQILEIIHQLREKENYRFTGFSDMDVDGLMFHTGLSHAQAELALKRDYTEPLLWQDETDRLQEFRQFLDKNDLTAVQGGRFLSISGKVDKGQALRWLREYYQEHYQSKLAVIAAGDSENDIAMLETADYPILVRSPTHELPDIAVNNLIVTQETGPLGWNNSILALLKH